jgi:hypothetical protein
MPSVSFLGFSTLQVARFISSSAEKWFGISRWLSNLQGYDACGVHISCLVSHSMESVADLVLCLCLLSRGKGFHPDRGERTGGVEGHMVVVPQYVK